MAKINYSGYRFPPKKHVYRFDRRPFPSLGLDDGLALAVAGTAGASWGQRPLSPTRFPVLRENA
jgi:hypothetical protein